MTTGLQRSAFPLLLALGVLIGCGDDTAPSDAAPPPDTSDVSVDGDAGDPCIPASLVEPIWIAGQTGARADVGAFGKPDAIFVLGDQLLAGDEDPAFEELHVYDLSSDDPAIMADMLTPLADLGADPGPAGTGELEFAGISGFAAMADGTVVVGEQGNDRLQLLTPIDTSPFFEFQRFLGAAAVNPDAPGPAEFIRLQALRVDSMNRLYVSDDGKEGTTEIGRRDIQVFDSEYNLLFTFGDVEGTPGEGGNIEEPENFAIDETRDRIYVCDEGPNNIAVFRYSDRSFLQRFGDGVFTGTTNGVDFDLEGRIYVVDEGNALTSGVRIFDPETFEELGRFGELSEESDLTPGTFNSPDTLLIYPDRDLLIVADQGHDRIQGFRLSDVQTAACIQ